MVIIIKYINYIINFNSDLAKRNIFNIIPADIFTNDSKNIKKLPLDKIKCRNLQRIANDKPYIKPRTSTERSQKFREKKKNHDNKVIYHV